MRNLEVPGYSNQHRQSDNFGLGVLNHDIQPVFSGARLRSNIKPIGTRNPAGPPLKVTIDYYNSLYQSIKTTTGQPTKVGSLTGHVAPKKSQELSFFGSNLNAKPCECQIPDHD